MLSSTTPPTAGNLRDRRGVLEWAFEAKPGEVRDIMFAWRVTWPKDKGAVVLPFVVQVVVKLKLGAFDWM